MKAGPSHHVPAEFCWERKIFSARLEAIVELQYCTHTPKMVELVNVVGNNIFASLINTNNVDSVLMIKKLLLPFCIPVV